MYFIYVTYKIWVDPDQEYLIQYLKWVEPLLQKESGSASFGTKVVPSLNGMDPSFLWTQLLDPTCRAKCSNILHDIAMLGVIMLGAVMLSAVAPKKVL
jgi:hypothetical protein